MQFKLDENLPPSVAELLRSLGHDVMTVYDQGLQSCTDPDVLAACQGEGRIRLSLDLDFSNILVFPSERYAGLIV
jgi:predicted nuclease of predicted toxin-antitoxin system